MNIRQLEAFRAVMIARSTTGAAELLDVSQPAVSRLIVQLEASLELTLFDRSSGRLAPTPEALLLHEEVERTFVSVDKIRELAREIKSAEAGSLNLAAFPLMALGFLPKAIRAFNDAHPRTRISLNVQMSPKIEEWAAAQQIDLGFAEYPLEPGTFQRTGIDVEEFARFNYLLGVPAGHRLASRRVVGPRDLEGERFISQTRNTVGRILMDRLFDKEGVRRELVLDTQVIAGVATFVSYGLGVGFIDPFTALDFADRQIVPVRFEPALEMRIGMLHPTHRPMSRTGRDFAGILRQRRRETLAEVERMLDRKGL
ncbi:LysR substrate-binding domain-containing protein [Alsobacter sp. SYSU BS001988]